jgi:hypothetical protein
MPPSRKSSTRLLEISSYPMRMECHLQMNSENIWELNTLNSPATIPPYPVVSEKIFQPIHGQEVLQPGIFTCALDEEANVRIVCLIPGASMHNATQGALRDSPKDLGSITLLVSYDGLTMEYCAVVAGRGMSMTFDPITAWWLMAERGMIEGKISMNGFGSMVRKSRFMW